MIDRERGHKDDTIEIGYIASFLEFWQKGLQTNSNRSRVTW